MDNWVGWLALGGTLLVVFGAFWWFTPGARQHKRNFGLKRNDGGH